MQKGVGCGAGSVCFVNIHMFFKWDNSIVSSCNAWGLVGYFLASPVCFWCRFGSVREAGRAKNHGLVGAAVAVVNDNTGANLKLSEWLGS